MKDFLVVGIIVAICLALWIPMGAAFYLAIRWCARVLGWA